MPNGSWPLTQELFERGDASFVSELRSVHAPEQLGAFAATWFTNSRPFARQALFDYLSTPLNCYRHEPLVKRLFKLAEAANDDEVMGAFLVAFDRTIRRNRRHVTQTKYAQYTSRAEAETEVREWEKLGFLNVSINAYGNNRFYAYASRPAEVVVTPNNRMPTPDEKRRNKVEKLNDWMRARFERHFILFSQQTRRYLRRRAWRYFRKLAKTEPQRYLQAVVKLLPRYRDTDIDSDIHLLDNWGLVHILFHDCSALLRPAKGWAFAADKGLNDLTFAPHHAAVWNEHPQLALDLLLTAGCRTVRLFAAWLLQTQHAAWLRQLPVQTLLKLADHADSDVSALGFVLLEDANDLSTVPVSEWLHRLDGDDLEKLTRFSNLLSRHLDPNRVPLAETIRLAAYRSHPIATLGYTLLKAKELTRADTIPLLTLTQAECDTVRPELIPWLRGKLSRLGEFDTSWVLEFLDSKHADVRHIGWVWLQTSEARDDTALWHKLLESPYEDVRGWLAQLLTQVATTANPETVRFLWATVLCSIHGGSRQKPGIVAQIVTRINQEPREADKLLPLLAVAVRSLRGPEFRTGLTGLVMLSETKPELLPLIRQQFPEITF